MREIQYKLCEPFKVPLRLLPVQLAGSLFMVYAVVVAGRP